MICSESSRAVGEPIAGTAVAHTWRWLGIAYPRRWEARAVDAADLGGARAWVDAFDARQGTRVQLLRQNGDEASVLFADTRQGRLHRFTLGDLPDLDALLEGSAGGRVDQTVVWVCTNGRRDACCARFGPAVYHALCDRLGDAVWQTTHLGGHRFAATLVVLPEGLCYGRLAPEQADGLVEAVRAGRVFDLDHLRGRVAWSRPAQVAEAAVRRAGATRVRLLGEAVEGDLTRVTLEVDGTPRAVDVAKAPLAPMIASCGKHPAPAMALREVGWDAS